MGAADGVSVGAADGISVGAADGVSVGAADGVSVGSADGVSVGSVGGFSGRAISSSFFSQDNSELAVRIAAMMVRFFMLLYKLFANTLRPTHTSSQAPIPQSSHGPSGTVATPINRKPALFGHPEVLGGFLTTFCLTLTIGRLGCTPGVIKKSMENEGTEMCFTAPP